MNTPVQYVVLYGYNLDPITYSWAGTEYTNILSRESNIDMEISYASDSTGYSTKFFFPEKFAYDYFLDGRFYGHFTLKNESGSAITYNKTTITLKKIDISGNEEVVSSMSKSYSAITVEDGDYSKLFFDVDIEKKRIRASERLVLTVGYTGHTAFSFSHDIDTSFGHDVIIHLPVASRGR